MREARRRAAEHHDLAAQANRTAAEHNEKAGFAAAIWHWQRVLEYSDQAFKLAKGAHNNAGQIKRCLNALLAITADHITKIINDLLSGYDERGRHNRQCCGSP
jgi:hypothetical protein